MMFRKFCYLVLVCLLSISSARAGDVDEWHLVSDRSQIDIRYVTDSFEGHGVLSNFQGDIKFSPDALDKSYVTIHIPMTSLRLENAEYMQIAKGVDWFDVKKYDFAIFQSSDFSVVEDEVDTYLAKGLLTIKETPKYIELPFTLKFSEDGEHVLMTSEATIQRLAFDVGVGDWSDTKTVADDVNLKISLRAVRTK